MQDNKTPARAYPLPDSGNTLQQDLPRLVSAINQIDADIAERLANEGNQGEQLRRLRINTLLGETIYDVI